MIALKYLVKSSDKKVFILSFSFLVLYQVILIFQGFDVCDEGWVLTFYQQIFNNPASVEYNFLYWLTGIVGGIWYSIFPSGGILAFRILTVIITTLILIISYLILKNYINKYQILLGLFITLLLQNYGLIVFHHNHLSSLLSLIAIFFLLKGLRKESFMLLAFSGCIIGLNIFSRLPNITLLIYITLIPFNAFFKKNSSKKTILQLTSFVAGICGALLFVFILLNALGHIDTFKNAIATLLQTGYENDSNHNVSRLFKAYIQNYKSVLKSSIWIILALSFTAILLKTKESFKLPKTPLIIVSLLISIFFLKGVNTYSIYFIGLLGVCCVFMLKRIDLDFKLLAIAASLMMIFLPLGSDSGIDNMGYYTLWLSTPIFIWLITQTKVIQFGITFANNDYSFSLSNVILKTSFIVLSFSYISIKLYQVSQNAYFDKGSRFEKTYTIHNPLSKGIYTKEERASIINEVLNVLGSYVGSNDYLLAYDNIPMIHFLTKTKPYMYNSWVWTYDSYIFENKLTKAEKNIPELPIVILQKFETIGDFSEPKIDYMSTDKPENYLYKRGRVLAMNAFLKRNKYRIVWSNFHFEILKPKD